ncbi:MAG TPA: hypothetical protein DCQ50_20485 [Chryseobacterium sp.]|nr:hypothetical protein [Chryseobacterium sp.]
MRRQDKYILDSALILAGATAIADLFMQWKEHKNNGIKFSWDLYDGKRTVRRSMIGGSIGAMLGYGFYKYKIDQEATLPFNSDDFVKQVLIDENIKSNPDLYKSVVFYRERVKQVLVDNFGNSLIAKPQDTGSFYKRTAIGSNYDIDIVLPFMRNSYNSLEEMYYSVHRVIGEAFGAEATITKQTKALGITFKNNGSPVHFDIVPGREINNYVIEKDLNLFVKPEWVWQSGSSFKTNIGIQKEVTVNNPAARTVIKLLKSYRDRNSLPLPSLLIERYVVDALSENNYGIYVSTTENFLNCMEFISKKMRQKRLIDSANSNNNLHHKLSEMQRQYISDQLGSDLQRIEENPRYIMEIFEC